MKRKYNIRDFDKSKSANLQKILRGNIPPKSGRIAALKSCMNDKLQCSCYSVMLYYSGADLARILNKVLGMEECLCVCVCVCVSVFYKKFIT